MINIIMISIGVSYIYNLEIVMLLLLINLIIYIYYFLQNYNRTLTKHYMSVLISRICYDNLYSIATLLTKFCVDFDTIHWYKRYKFLKNKRSKNV